jgi:hypothetical protein
VIVRDLGDGGNKSNLMALLPYSFALINHFSPPICFPSAVDLQIFLNREPGAKDAKVLFCFFSLPFRDGERMTGGTGKVYGASCVNLMPL